MWTTIWHQDTSWKKYFYNTTTYWSICFSLTNFIWFIIDVSVLCCAIIWGKKKGWQMTCQSIQIFFVTWEKPKMNFIYFVHILYYYLSHKSEESCSQSKGATGLFRVPDRGQSSTLQKSRPLIQCSFQRFAQFLKREKTMRINCKHRQQVIHNHHV